MDPDDIIRALQDGAKWGEQAMVTLVCPVLLGYAEAIAPDLSTADQERAVEAAVLRGVAKLEQFDRRRGTFTGWLRPFVRNAVNDIRREQGGTAAPLPAELALRPEESDDPTAVAEARAMQVALGSLSDMDRLIITLRDYEFLSYDSCAERIGGVSAAACRVRHFRALRRLLEAAKAQPELQQYLGEEVQ